MAFGRDSSADQGAYKSVSVSGSLAKKLGDQRDTAIQARADRLGFGGLVNKIEKLQAEKIYADRETVQKIQEQIHDFARQILKLKPDFNLQSLGIDKDML